MKGTIPAVAIALSCLHLISTATGDALRVSDTDGRSIDIDLLAVSGDTVTFTLKGKTREHDVEIDRFDDASKKLILETAKKLKPRYPKLEIEAVVNKRRKKSDKSFYWVIQNVSSKLKIRNTSLTVPMPETTAKISFIGRGRRTGDVHKVLGAEEFKIEIPAGKDFEYQTEEIHTEYDSDKRGYGNIGGYQYDSYVLAFIDSEGRVIDYKTTDPTIRSLVEDGKITLPKILSYRPGTLLTEDMLPTSSGVPVR